MAGRLIQPAGSTPYRRVDGSALGPRDHRRRGRCLSPSIQGLARGGSVGLLAADLSPISCCDRRSSGFLDGDDAVRSGEVVQPEKSSTDQLLALRYDLSAFWKNFRLNQNRTTVASSVNPTTRQSSTFTIAWLGTLTTSRIGRM